jgi:hypothetical protein
MKCHKRRRRQSAVRRKELIVLGRQVAGKARERLLRHGIDMSTKTVEGNWAGIEACGIKSLGVRGAVRGYEIGGLVVAMVV